MDLKDVKLGLLAKGGSTLVETLLRDLRTKVGGATGGQALADFETSVQEDK